MKLTGPVGLSKIEGEMRRVLGWPDGEISKEAGSGRRQCMSWRGNEEPGGNVTNSGVSRRMLGRLLKRLL